MKMIRNAIRETEDENVEEYDTMYRVEVSHDDGVTWHTTNMSGYDLQEYEDMRTLLEIVGSLTFERIENHVNNMLQAAYDYGEHQANSDW